MILHQAVKSPSSSPLRKKTYMEHTNDVEMKDCEDADVMDCFEEITENMKNSTEEVKHDDVVKEEPKQTSEKYNEDIKYRLEEKIKELELIIEKDKAEKKRLNDEIAKLENKKQKEQEVRAFESKINKKPFKIPKHLKSVHEGHLKNLRGFKMRYCSVPDGACLINCLYFYFYFFIYPKATIIRFLNLDINLQDKCSQKDCNFLGLGM